VARADGQRTTVGALADTEPLCGAPVRAYPAVVRRSVVVARDASVAFEGNRDGLLPSLIGQTVIVRRRSKPGSLLEDRRGVSRQCAA
jgi:hypothetical protein